MLPIKTPDFMENDEWYRYDEEKRKYVLTKKAPKKAVKSYNDLYSALGNRYFMAHSALKGILPECIVTATVFWIVSPIAENENLYDSNFFDLRKENDIEVIKPKKTVLSLVRDAVTSGLYMPCGLKAGELNKYHFYHEGGHRMQNMFFYGELLNHGWSPDDVMKFVDEKYSGICNPKRYKWYYDILKELMARQRREIIEIAKKANPDFSEIKNLSKVAMLDDAEFFAEASVNSESSTPNEIGRAMIEWLEKNDSTMRKLLELTNKKA